MTDENICYDGSETKRRRAALPPDQAALRQRQLALEDSECLYKATIATMPLRVVNPSLQKSLSTSRLLLASADLPPALHIEVATEIHAIEKAAQHAEDVVRRLLLKTQDSLHRRRMREFQIDFNQPCETQLQRLVVCLICDKTARRAYAMPCCTTADSVKMVCLPCLRKTAYYKSHHGTEPMAPCPFCNKTFDVYRTRKRKRRVDEVDEPK